MNGRIRLLTAVALGFAGLGKPPMAQDIAPDPIEPQLPRYHVEVIVFSHEDFNATEELFEHRPRETVISQERRFARPIIVGPFIAHDPELAPDFELQRPPRKGPPIILDALPTIESLAEVGNEIRVQTADDTAILLPGVLPADLSDEPPLEPVYDLPLSITYKSPGEGTTRSLRFRLLEDDELQLAEDYAALERLPAYRILIHGGWVQEALPVEEASPFNVSYLGAINPVGTIQLRVSRFLHLTVDLDYRLPRPQPAPYSFFFETFELSEIEMGPRYSLSEERNAMYSGELHYIDHPAFGLLVLITPAPEKPEEDGDVTTDGGPAA